MRQVSGWNHFASMCSLRVFIFLGGLVAILSCYLMRILEPGRTSRLSEINEVKDSEMKQEATLRDMHDRLFMKWVDKFGTEKDIYGCIYTVKDPSEMEVDWRYIYFMNDDLEGNPISLCSDELWCS